MTTASGPSGSGDPIRLPDEADIDAVVALAPGNFANLIRCAQHTGMRQEEVASLDVMSQEVVHSIRP